MAALTGGPELAHHVTVWRVDTLVADEEEMDCAGDPQQFIRLVGAVVELWGPAAAVAGWADGAAGLPAMLEAAWRVQHPGTEVVLAAIGAEHPDKAVAKTTARKALFKLMSGG